MRILILGLIFLLSTACSRTDFVVRFFDTIAVSKTDDYFDLSSNQREELKKGLQEDVEKVRKEVFPEVAKTLRHIEPEVKKEKLDLPTVDRHFTEFQSYFKKISGYFKNTAVRVSLTFKPQQFDHFAKELRKEISDNTKDNKDPEDSEDITFKRYRRSIEFWVGGLSSDQKEKIRKFIKTHPFPWQLQNKNKEFVLQKFLESKEQPEKLKNFVSQFYEDYEIVRLPEFTIALNEHKKAFQKFLLEDFWGSLSPTQKQNLRENLIARAEELEKIAHRP